MTATFTLGGPKSAGLLAGALYSHECITVTVDGEYVTIEGEPEDVRRIATRCVAGLNLYGVVAYRDGSGVEGEA